MNMQVLDTPELHESMKKYDDGEWQDLADLFKLLSDPVTIKILGFIGAYEVVRTSEIVEAIAPEVCRLELGSRLLELERIEAIWREENGEWLHWWGFPFGGNGWEREIAKRLDDKFLMPWGGSFVNRCKAIVERRPADLVVPSKVLR